MDGHIKPSRLFALADANAEMSERPEAPHFERCSICQDAYLEFVQQIAKEKSTETERATRRPA
jgi:hypothetical protein